GSKTAAGMQLWYTMLPQLVGLSATTGSQTLSGNIELDSPLRLTSGATTTNTGVMNLTGNIAGSSWLEVQSSRAVFSGNIANTGGMRLGEIGFTTQVTFLGTT